MPVWGVSITFLREVSRSLGFRVFVPLLLLLAAFLPRFAGGPNLLSELQVLASYGLGVPSIIVALASLVFVSSSLANDIDQRHAHLIVTKPIARPLILLGKWLGALLLNLALLFALSLVFVGNLWLLLGETHEADETDRATRRFLSSRSAFAPIQAPPDEQLVRQRVDAIRQQRLAALAESEEDHEGHDHAGHDHSHGHGLRPQVSHASLDEEAIERRVRRILNTRSIAPGEELTLEFAGLRREARDNERLQLRLRITLFPPSRLEVPLSFRTDGDFELRRFVASSSWQEIDLPSSAVDANGLARVRIECAADAGARVALAPDGVELLQVYGSVYATLFRSVLALAIQFAFLSAVGLFGAACFSLPTTILVGVLVYLLGLTSGFLAEVVSDFYSGAGFEALIADSLVVLLRSVPDFGGENPIARIVDGRALELGVFFEASAQTLVLRVGAVLVIASLVFWRRELGGARA